MAHLEPRKRIDGSVTYYVRWIDPDSRQRETLKIDSEESAKLLLTVLKAGGNNIAVAYASLEDLGERQTAVRSSISALGAACNQKIAHCLGVPVNQVTGRVFELRGKGPVREAYKAVWVPPGRTVIWRETV
ncbi:hypothetical protein [Pseudarthrobacter albicanus]|uniref:hypothetical protein n=1 Tax=Pseudarthrobacter albicanus TaxID=2823873 RepID=UPI001FE5A8E8|nr:hypothetical protein [Pseudarthrobacter albicanus]